MVLIGIDMKHVVNEFRNKLLPFYWIIFYIGLSPVPKRRFFVKPLNVITLSQIKVITITVLLRFYLVNEMLEILSQ